MLNKGRTREVSVKNPILIRARLSSVYRKAEMGVRGEEIIERRGEMGVDGNEVYSWEV